MHVMHRLVHNVLIQLDKDDGLMASQVREFVDICKSADAASWPSVTSLSFEAAQATSWPLPCSNYLFEPLSQIMCEVLLAISDRIASQTFFLKQ